jgi:hypothetical protein
LRVVLEVAGARAAVLVADEAVGGDLAGLNSTCSFTSLAIVTSVPEAWVDEHLARLPAESMYA